VQAQVQSQEAQELARVQALVLGQSQEVQALVQALEEQVQELALELALVQAEVEALAEELELVLVPPQVEFQEQQELAQVIEFPQKGDL
jgi:hypothetical protein